MYRPIFLLIFLFLPLLNLLSANLSIYVALSLFLAADYLLLNFLLFKENYLEEKYFLRRCSYTLFLFFFLFLDIFTVLNFIFIFFPIKEKLAFAILFTFANLLPIYVKKFLQYKPPCLSLSTIFRKHLYIFLILLFMFTPLVFFLMPSRLLWDSSLREILGFILYLIALGIIDYKIITRPRVQIKSFDSSSVTVDRPVYLLGLDAADWEVLIPLIKLGLMPNLAKILDQGNTAYGKLTCYDRSVSPVVWTTLATGATSQQHSIEGFINYWRVGKGSLFRSSDRKVPAIWNLLTHFHKKSGVINWLISYPAEDIKGIMLSSLVRKEDPQNSNQEEYQKVLDGILEEIGGAGQVENVKGKEDEKIREDAQKEIDILEKLVSHLSGEAFDFLAIYEQGTDAVQHRFWKYRPGEKFDRILWEVDLLRAKDYQGSITKQWEKVDGLIGQIYEKSKRDSALLAIVSDHGARRRYRPLIHLEVNKLLKDLGYYSGGESENVAYLADPTVWTSQIKININEQLFSNFGDNPEFKEKREAVCQHLLNLKINGKKPIFFLKGVGRKEYGADIILEQSEEIRRKKKNRRIKVGIFQKELDTYLKTVTYSSGEHQPEGIFLLWGDVIKKGCLDRGVINNGFTGLLEYLRGYENKKILERITEFAQMLDLVNECSTLDVAPTILYLLNIPIPDYCGGKPMLKSLRKEYVDSRPVEKIASDALKWKPAKEQTPSPQGQETEEKIKERLRDLGYID